VYSQEVMNKKSVHHAGTHADTESGLNTQHTENCKIWTVLPIPADVNNQVHKMSWHINGDVA